MNAALEAATNGAKVYLIDKNDDMGGSIRFAGGTTSAAGAKMQIEAGVEDSPENFQADIVRHQRAGADQEAHRVRGCCRGLAG